MTTFSARRSRRRAVASLALVGVTAFAVLAACGDDAKSSEPGRSNAPTSTAASSSSAADPHAGWTVAKLGNGQFQLPPGWTMHPAGGQLGFDAPKGQYITKPGGASFASNTTPRASTEADVPSALGLFKGMQLAKIKRLPDVTLGGVVFYHVQAESKGNWYDMFGTVRNGYLVHVLWTMMREIIDRADATKLINQVMTTFKPL